MNPVHVSLVNYIRGTSPPEGSAIYKIIDGKTDDQIVRLMFQNYRGKDKAARGLRLTNFGVQVMQTYFQAYEITAPEGRIPGAHELVYLDRTAKLPYHIGTNGNMMMFDPELGIKLKLADGDIRTLIEMDS